MIELCGKVVDLNYDSLTVNQAADVIAREYPAIWRRIYTEQYDAPGNYYSFKAPAVTMATACIENALRRTMSRNIATTNIEVAAGQLEAHDYPTYYVGASLFEMLRHMHPPRKMKWADLTFGGFNGVLFMLPIGALIHYDGESIPFLGVAKLQAGKALFSPSGEEYQATSDDKVVLFWSTHAGVILDEFTCSALAPLEPDPDWINRLNERTNRAHYDRGPILPPGANLVAVPDPTITPPQQSFTSYICALTANLLLAQEAMPEQIDRGEFTGRRIPSSGVPIHRPTFLGRKYQTARRVRRTPTGAHFTKEGWRAGCFRRQHYGKGGAEVRIKVIPSYIAMSKELVRPGQKPIT